MVNKAASRSPVNNNNSPDARVASKAASRAVAVNKAGRIVRLNPSQSGNPLALSPGDFHCITLVH